MTTHPSDTQILTPPSDRTRTTLTSWFCSCWVGSQCSATLPTLLLLLNLSESEQITTSTYMRTLEPNFKSGKWIQKLRNETNKLINSMHPIPWYSADVVCLFFFLDCLFCTYCYVTFFLLFTFSFNRRYFQFTSFFSLQFCFTVRLTWYRNKSHVCYLSKNTCIHILSLFMLSIIKFKWLLLSCNELKIQKAWKLLYKHWRSSSTAAAGRWSWALLRQ